MTDTTQDPRDAKVAELQAKLTEAERLNNVALDAMKNASKYPEYDSRHDEYRHCCCNAKSNKPHLETCYINNAIKEIEGAMPTRHRREQAMSDLIKNLRDLANHKNHDLTLADEAADRISELKAEVKALDGLTDRQFVRISNLIHEVARLTTHIRAIADYHDGLKYSLLDGVGSLAWKLHHTERRDFALKVFDV